MIVRDEDQAKDVTLFNEDGDDVTEEYLDDLIIETWEDETRMVDNVDEIVDIMKDIASENPGFTWKVKSAKVGWAGEYFRNASGDPYGEYSSRGTDLDDDDIPEAYGGDY